MVESIKLVKRMSKGNQVSGKLPKPYVAVSVNLGYREILLFPQSSDIMAMFDITDREFQELEVGYEKPLVFVK